MTALIIIAIVLAIYLTHHGRHYRRRRRAGLTVRESLPGPWGTRISISKRFPQ
jgi:hypothetical protein